MKISTFLTSIILYLLLACSSSKKVSDINNQVRSYANLFIVANTTNIMARVRLEKGLVEVVESKGYNAVKSLDVLPFSLNEPKFPTKEEFDNKLKESGCDALLIIQYLKEGETVKYNPGTNFKGGQALGSLLGKSIGNKEPETLKSVLIPGHFTKDNFYYLSADLIDDVSKEIVYSEKSTAFDDQKLESFSHAYLTALVKNLEAKKYLKK